VITASHPALGARHYFLARVLRPGAVRVLQTSGERQALGMKPNKVELITTYRRDRSERRPCSVEQRALVPKNLAFSLSLAYRWAHVCFYNPRLSAIKNEGKERCLT
jgi:hypothetical protein